MGGFLSGRIRHDADPVVGDVLSVFWRKRFPDSGFWSTEHLLATFFFLVAHKKLVDWVEYDLDSVDIAPDAGGSADVAGMEGFDTGFTGRFSGYGADILKDDGLKTREKKVR